MVSHVGGHKFAGNVIIYPGGHWYGRVQPCDAKVIVEEHLMKQRVVKERWRGVMDGTLSDSGNDQG
jgi:(2Fe-2S) ferredoxin